MARETKAERLERETAEKLVQQAAQAATYPQRLMALMQRAQTANFELEVVNMSFVLRDRDDRDYTKFELDLAYSDVAEDDLRDLEWRVDAKEQEAREALRRVTVRNAALAKLSKEERELLGL